MLVRLYSERPPKIDTQITAAERAAPKTAQLDEHVQQKPPPRRAVAAWKTRASKQAGLTGHPTRAAAATGVLRAARRHGRDQGGACPKNDAARRAEIGILAIVDTLDIWDIVDILDIGDILDILDILAIVDTLDILDI